MSNRNISYQPSLQLPPQESLPHNSEYNGHQTMTEERNRVGTIALHEVQLRSMAKESVADTNSEILGSFASARNVFYKMTVDPGFMSELAANKLRLSDSDKPGYWRTLQAYATDRTQKMRARTPAATLAIDCLNLSVATPDYIFSQCSLGANNTSGGASTHDNVVAASKFGGALRSFAASHPQVTAMTLQQSCLNIANISLPPKQRQAAIHVLRTAIRGARHEVGFGQMLGHTNWQIVPQDAEAATQNDLKGIDFILRHNQTGQIMRVDLKASLSEIEARGGHSGPYYHRSADHIIMYSMIQDSFNSRGSHSDFAFDTFYISEEIARSRAGVIEQLLDSAARGVKGADFAQGSGRLVS